MLTGVEYILIPVPFSSTNNFFYSIHSLLHLKIHAR